MSRSRPRPHRCSCCGTRLAIRAEEIPNSWQLLSHEYSAKNLALTGTRVSFTKNELGLERSCFFQQNGEGGERCWMETVTPTEVEGRSASSSAVCFFGMNGLGGITFATGDVRSRCTITREVATFILLAM